MIDLVGVDAPAAITADDFAFHVGNDDDPANWPEAPPPASVTVRSGDGAGGSDRVTLIWDDAEITQAWLQVTVKAGGATDLVLDHLFLFGNAVGETGNDPANALVTAADLVAIRDNPRSAGNRADIASPQDLNRDQHVDALDAVLARNHATGPFNALRLITPSLPTPPPPEAEAEASGATAGLSNSAKQPATSLGATGCLPASAGQTAGLPQLAQRHNLPTPHRPTSLLEQTNSLPHRRTAKQPSDHPFAEIDSALADLLATDWR